MSTSLCNVVDEIWRQLAAFALREVEEDSWYCQIENDSTKCLFNLLCEYVAISE